MNPPSNTTTEVYWTAEQIAEYTGQSVESIRKWCHRHGVRRIPDPDGGREHVARAEDVKVAVERMRGQGWRRGQYGGKKQ